MNNILGIDIGGTAIKLSLIDSNSQMVWSDELYYEGKISGEEIIRILTKKIAGLTDFKAIGISTAGQVDSEEGIITYANENIPNYTGTNLKKNFEEAFNVPVLVENDVNAAALGERKFGIGKNYRNFLCLTFGTGIGGSIVIDSKVYKGENGLAGEFGHILVHADGKRCSCGNKGCYEAYAATTALINQAKLLDKECVNGKIFFSKIQEGNTKLESLLLNWIDEVALGLVSLIHIFNPPVIILGGGIMEQEGLVHRIEEKVKELVMDSYKEVKLLKASLGNKAGVYGAVSLHLEKGGR